MTTTPFLAPKFTPAEQAERQRQAERQAFLLKVQERALMYGPRGSVGYRNAAKRMIRTGRIDALTTQRLPITVTRTGKNTRIVEVNSK